MNLRILFRSRPWIGLLAATWLAATGGAAPIYVTTNGTDLTGGSWATPTSLTNALAIATSGSEIWIAEGIYTNTATFTVRTNCTLYGGFTNGMATLGERDWVAHPALLSGNAQNLRVVTVTGTNVTLDGLVITNSSGGSAGGITKAVAGPLVLANCSLVAHTNTLNSGGYGGGGSFTAGSIVMTNCLVANNIKGGYSSYGFGLYASGVNLDMVDCVVSNQYGESTAARSGYGAGLSFQAGTCRVVRTTFVDNKDTANGGGGGAAYIGNGAALSATFSNCVFRGNQIQPYTGNAGLGGGLWVNAQNVAKTVTVVNCTFAGNTNYAGHGGAIYLSQGTLILKNSILWANGVERSGYTAREIYVEGGALLATYGCLSGKQFPHVFVAGGSASFSSCMTNNPLLAGPTDVHLSSPAGRWQGGSFVTTDTAYSPCIDAGDPAGAIGSEPAENGSRVNVGAYGGTGQASKGLGAAPQVANRGAGSFDYTRMAISGELVNASAVIADVGICFGTNDVAGDTTNGWEYVRLIYPPQQTGTAFSVITPFLMTNTTYYYRCYATNAFGGHWPAASTFVTGAAYPPLLGVGGGTNVVHVRAGAVGEADGSDWYNAYIRLSDGIAALGGTRTNLWITGGSYGEGVLLTLGANATVVGGFAGTEAAVTGRVLTNGAGVVTNYTAIQGGGSHRCLLITGGNAWLDTLTFSNCPSARALEKAGAGNLVLNNCRFEQNSMPVAAYNGVGNGVGAYLGAGTVTMTNCVVANNSLPGVAGEWQWSNLGVGVYAAGVTLDIVDCVFSNQWGHAYAARTLCGAALAFNSGTLRVRRSEFVGNRGTANGGGGGAVYLGSAAAVSASFSNCVFRQNEIQLYGGAPGFGGALWVNLNSVASTAQIVNCTFAGNTNAVGNGGAIYLTQGTLVLKNAILWTNLVAAGYTGHELYRAGGTINASYCSLSDTVSPQVYGSPTLTGCRAGDPLLAASTDMHLKSATGRWDPAVGGFVTTDTVYSPCLDAGDPTDPVGLEPMPNEGTINMGAYGGTAQASKSPPNGPPLLADRGAEVFAHRARIRGELTNGTPVTALVGLCYGTNSIGADTTNGWEYVVPIGAPQQTGTVFLATTPALAPNRTYSYRWYATNKYADDWTAVATFETGDLPAGGGADVIHVKRDATGAADGSDWTNAFTKIADAIVVLGGTRTNIWVTGGRQTEGLLLSLAGNAVVIGGFQGQENAVAERTLTNTLGVATNYTVIDGQGTVAGFNITAGNVWLDTLAITNAPSGGALTKGGAGALVVNNCRIVDNRRSSINGTGIGCTFTGGTVLMTNCLVADNAGLNYGQKGFGVYAMGANLKMVDCVVSNNSGGGFTTRQSFGCGLYFDNGTLNVLRTDFLSNTGGVNNGTGGGGAVYLGGNANLYASFSHCVFRGNRALATGSGGKGGAIWANLSSLSKTVLVANCTFADNRNETTGAFASGGAITVSKGTLVIRNCIFWTNSVQDGVSGLEICADSANSLVVGSYTCITATNAPYVVATNSAAIQWGSGMLSMDPQYAGATDVHLKSKGGRWDPSAVLWVNDLLTSPCIDAGDPEDSIGLESRPNGNRINLGAYGGTAQASKTYQSGTVFVVK